MSDSQLTDSGYLPLRYGRGLAFQPYPYQRRFACASYELGIAVVASAAASLGVGSVACGFGPERTVSR